METAKALGGSFKVTLAPKTVREMTQLPKETQKDGDTKKSKRTNKHAKHQCYVTVTLMTFDKQSNDCRRVVA